MLPTSPIPPSSATSGNSAKPVSVDQLLPAGGRELSAVVRQVASGDLGSQVFRVQVEANNRLMELITRAPLNTGDRITLSRSPGGELLLSLPTPQTAPNTSTTQTTTALLLQATTAQTSQLQQALPLNSPQTAQVLSSAPANGGASNPASSSTTVSTAAPNQGTPATAPATPPTVTQSATSTGPQAPPPAAQRPQAQPSQNSERPAASDRAMPSPPGSNPPVASTQPAMATSARSQIYAAQLQQINQLGQALSQSLTTPAASSTTTTPTQTATATPQAPGDAPAANPAAGRGPATAPGTTGPSATTAANTSSHEIPASQQAQTPAPARISQTGSQLLQTLTPAPAQPQTHLVQFSLASQQLQLISPRPLQPGQQVILTRTADQQVQLQLATAAELPGRSPAAQTAMQQALREALPQQVPFGDALNQLVQLSQTPAARGQSAIGQLVQSMLSLFSVTPGAPDAEQSIQRNLQQGGLFTEARLAQGDKPPADLKQQLGQLLKAAEQLPPEPRQQLQRLVDALQARSTSQQVSSLQAWKELPDGGQERIFRLDLPIRQAERHDTAELSISEQRRPDPEGGWQSSWSVALSFDLQQQGSIDVRLSLQEDWRLRLQFWAEQTSTWRRIEQQLEPFTQELHHKGFIVDHIQARQGKPHQPKLNDIQRRLVDVHT